MGIYIGNVRELSVQRRDNLADSLGGTGGGRNDVVVHTTTPTPVLMRWTIDGLLGSGGSVDGAH